MFEPMFRYCYNVWKSEREIVSPYECLSDTCVTLVCVFAYAIQPLSPSFLHKQQ